MQIDEFLARLEHVHFHGRYWKAQCPAHEDHVSSLQISEEEENIWPHCHAGCRQRDVVEKMGLRMSDLRYETRDFDWDAPPDVVYPYRDENGKLLYEICRWDTPLGKEIRPRKPDGSWGIRGVRQVLYRLPELVRLQHAVSPFNQVYIVEGEKDVEQIRAQGLVATTPPFGAGKWRAGYVKYFLGLRVVVVADRDTARADGSSPGLDHAREIADSLEGVAESVRLVQARAGKDVTDHLAAGFTLAELEEI